MVLGHDHRFSLQHTGHDRLSGPGKQGQVQPQPGVPGGGNKLPERDPGLDQGDAVLKIDPHHPVHPAQIDDDRSPDTGNGIAAKMW